MKHKNYKYLGTETRRFTSQSSLTEIPRSHPAKIIFQPKQKNILIEIDFSVFDRESRVNHDNKTKQTKKTKQR